MGEMKFVKLRNIAILGNEVFSGSISSETVFISNFTVFCRRLKFIRHVYYNSSVFKVFFGNSVKSFFYVCGTSIRVLTKIA